MKTIQSKYFGFLARYRVVRELDNGLTLIALVCSNVNDKFKEVVVGEDFFK